MEQEQEGDGDISPTDSQPSKRRRWVVAATLRTHYPREISSSHCVKGLGRSRSLSGQEGKFRCHRDW